MNNGHGSKVNNLKVTEQGARKLREVAALSTPPVFGYKDSQAVVVFFNMQIAFRGLRGNDAVMLGNAEDLRDAIAFEDLSASKKVIERLIRPLRPTTAIMNRTSENECQLPPACTKANRSPIPEESGGFLTELLAQKCCFRCPLNRRAFKDCGGGIPIA